MVPTTLLKVLNENPFLNDVATFYKNAGYQLYLVGGAVRDGILDIQLKISTLLLTRMLMSH